MTVFNVSTFKEKAPTVEAVEFSDMASAGLVANFVQAEAFQANRRTEELILTLNVNQAITVQLGQVVFKVGDAVHVASKEEFYARYEAMTEPHRFE